MAEACGFLSIKNSKIAVTKKSQPSQNLIITACPKTNKLLAGGALSPNLQRVCKAVKHLREPQKNNKRKKYV
jgi:hypothetical protein